MCTRRLHNLARLTGHGIFTVLACAAVWGQAVLPGSGDARSVLGLVPRHATISVGNLEVEKDWYMTKLGFNEISASQPAGQNGKIQGTELEIPGFQIHLIQFVGSRRATAPNPIFLAQGWVHVAFSVADIRRASAFLKAAGVEVQEIHGQNGAVGTLVLHDPEGNEVELFSR